MLGDVLGQEPALYVGRPAGREVDQKRQPLALVERLLGARRAGGECDEESDNEEESTRHAGFPTSPRVRERSSKARVRGPLRDSERRNSAPSGEAPSPHPLPARGERESSSADRVIIGLRR